MLTILLVEDNPGDARLISEHLREKGNLVDDFSVVHVERVTDAVKVLNKRADIDIVLSDITLPDSRGEDTLTALNTAANKVLIIFMTGTNDEGLAISAIHKGAQDYLVKGRIDSDVLFRSIQYSVERKKFQNEMNRVIANNKLNEERIKMLAEQKRQLIKLNHSKDDFVSIASHQLRTPATAVKQFLGMVVEGMTGEVNEAQLTLLRHAYESNERQLNVINELLKTAQLDSSKFKLTLQPCSINQIVRECTNDVMEVAALRKQKITLTLGDECEIKADHDELKLVFDNLLENASKYTPLGKRITITTQKNNHKVFVSVEDEGVGIKKEDQKIIFDKFSRVNNDLSDTVQGNGLGLYWVKRILKLHKGTIKVNSALGQGSKFIVSLPV